MDSDKSESLDNEDKEASQHSTKSGKKKKKKKKKKLTTPVEEFATTASSTSACQVSKLCENVLPSRQITPEEKSELNALHSNENNPSSPPNSEKSSEAIKDEVERVLDVGSSTTDRSNPPSEMLTQTKRKKRKNKRNSEDMQVLSEDKESCKLKTPDGMEKLKNSGREKPSDRVTGGRQNLSKENSSSPPVDRKKKKKRKAGILLSDVNLSQPQNDSDKEKKESKPSAKDAKNLLDVSQRDSATRESDYRTFSDSSLLQPETREK